MNGGVEVREEVTVTSLALRNSIKSRKCQRRQKAQGENSIGGGGGGMKT
jgi:hypothetical protein